jgi:integrase
VGRALSLGLRQGEALGLKWSDQDLTAGRLIVRRSRQRPRWEHGYGGKCLKPKAGYCPARVAAREDTAETKSRNGRRVIDLPGELTALLQQHRAEQDGEREAAAQLW